MNVRSAFIKTARFRYYLPLGNVLLGGAASIYAGHNQHKNYRADFNKPYVAESPQSIYAGSYFLPVYRWWSGGGINGNLLVFIDKQHAAWGLLTRRRLPREVHRGLWGSLDWTR